MAENPEIPQPASSGATDHPDAAQSGTPQIPPPPQGAMDAPPANTPAPAGASDTPPSTESGQPDQSLLSKVNDVAGDISSGFGNALMETVHGIGSGLKKIPQVALAEKLSGHELIPQAGLDAEQKGTPSPQNPAQWVGYGGENLAEFMLGDEALKGLSMADKFKQISGVMGILEKSPRLMKMLQMGVDVGKAQAELGPEEQAALKKSPMLARLVGTGMDALRQGVVQGAQTTAKTGDVAEGAKQGAETGLASGVLGTIFGALGRATEKAGEAGKAVQEASELGKNAPTSSELGKNISDQINDAETKMHGDFETGIQKLSGDLKGQKIPYQGSPLQKAATNLLESSADVPENKTTTLGKEFQALGGGSDTTKKLLLGLTEPNKAGDLTIDELVQRRQQLGEKIGQLTKGATSSADRADVQVYQKLRDGIDDTIQGLAKQSGKPEAAQDYDALRAAYKDKVKLFQSPAMQAMSAPGVASDTKLDNAFKYLTSSGNKIDKVNTLTETIGEPAVKDLGKGIIQKQLADASTDGQINPAKFVKNFKQIDNLPPEVKEKLFDMPGAQAGLDKLSSDLKSAANYQKLVRAGIIGGASAAGGAAGHAVHAGGELGAIPIVLGLAGERGSDLLDKIANSPSMWKNFRRAGAIGATLEESPAARRLGTAVKYGAGNALGNVLGGATEPLSQPEDQNVVYTNQ